MVSLYRYDAARCVSRTLVDSKNPAERIGFHENVSTEGYMANPEPLLTLEPLMEAVRDGASSAGWGLSGMQKTTSQEFEGRWSGASTRSAYLFFHHPLHEAVSVDVYLDETSDGLRGNLALVADVHPVPELPGVPEALEGVAELARRHLPDGYRTPVTLRLRLGDPRRPAEDAALETRLKLVLPPAALDAGHGAVAALTSTTLSAFERLLADDAAARWLELE
jgi:hypothetical protein